MKTLYYFHLKGEDPLPPVREFSGGQLLGNNFALSIFPSMFPSFAYQETLLIFGTLRLHLGVEFYLLLHIVVDSFEGRLRSPASFFLPVINLPPLFL